MSNRLGYEEQIANYTEHLRSLFAESDTANEAGTVTRGGAALPVDAVAERSEELVETLQQIGELTTTYLDTGSPTEQEAAEMKLLAQASAEIRVAQGLLELAEHEARGAESTVRSGVTVDIQQTLDDLAGVLKQPMTAGVPTQATRSVEDRPKEPDSAKTDLQKEVELSLRLICRQAARIGGQAAQTLVLMDSEMLKKGVAMVNADLAKLLDQISTGLSQTVKRIARSAVRLLLQAYDWVLALLGKGGEAQARKKVADWLEELKKEPKDEAGLIAGLVNRLYRPDSIGNEVNNWLQANQVEVATLNRAAESVQGLGQKYEAKSDQAGKVLMAIGVIKSLPVPFVKIPQLQILFAAVSLGILGYVLFTGYDHVDSGRIQFLERFGINIPDRVEGIRETAQKALEHPYRGTESKSNHS